MNKWMYVAIPFLVAAVLRLYPYFVTDLPFAIDAWAPVKNTELILENTPVNLDNEILDGYNNYWPANSLFGAIVSEVTALPPLIAMAIFLPITGAITILIFFTLIRRIYNSKIAFIASLIFATAFTHAFFTAGVTKETFANPLYILLILIFLHPAMGKRKQILLFAVTSTTLALTHHLTSIITIAILSSIALARLVNTTRKGLPTNTRDFLLLAILTVIVFTDFALYAHKGFRLGLTTSDWLSVASYQILTFALALYLMLKPSTTTVSKAVATSLGALALGLVFTILMIKKPLISGLPVMPESYLIYNSPYIIITSLVTLGYGYRRQHVPLLIPMFWLAVVAALEGYAVFANSGLSIMLANRALNFLHPAIAILAAVGIYRLFKGDKKKHFGKALKTFAVVTLLLITILNIYTMYAAISLEERYLGPSCLYKKQEFSGAEWISENSEDLMIAADWKISALLEDYFQSKANRFQAFLYFGDKTEPQPQILFIYEQMTRNGYLISYRVLDLPETWLEQTAKLNHIYANGVADLYAGDTI